MGYTYDDVFDAKMEASCEAEYYAYKKCLELIDRVIPSEPHAGSERSDWEKDTRTLRALRGDISDLYHQAEYRMEEAKHKKALADKDAMIEQLRSKLAALESKEADPKS